MTAAPSNAPAVLLAAAAMAVGGAFYVAFGMDGAALEFAAHYGVLDATSRLFLVLINGIFFGVATHVVGSAADPDRDVGTRLPRFTLLALLFMLMCNLAVLSRHLLMMLVFLELSTIAAAPLVRHGRSAASMYASWRYLLFSTVGLGLAWLGAACLVHGMEGHGADPSFFLDGISRASHEGKLPWRRVGVALLVLGIGTKLALAPMYAWLPETYEAAPPPVTALLAAVQFNVALVAVWRLLQVLGPVDAQLMRSMLMTLGMVTMVASAFGIIATRRYRRLIAYASLNHGGVIAVGLGLGQTAAYGVLIYVVSNAIIKAILFLTAGKIRAVYATEDVGEVTGLLKDLPYTGVFFMMGTFALLGFPPFGSFLGELIIMRELIRVDQFLVFGGLCTTLTATFVATGRSVFPMIWGDSRRTTAVPRAPMGSLIPKLVFVVFLVAMGIHLPAPISALFRQVASNLGGA